MNGLTTGVVDTITKPTKGLFDLIEGTASAVRSTIRENNLKLSGFPQQRIRLPQFGYKPNQAIRKYDKEWVESQHAFKRIVGSDSEEMWVFLSINSSTVNLFQILLIDFYVILD